MADTITTRRKDFTNRDFDSWILTLRILASSAIPNWTDFNRANFGNILLESFAHTLDVISYTQDQQLFETRISLARLRRSMIFLGRNVGFELPGATVATVDLEITIADGLPRVADIVVPAGTVVVPLDSTNDVEFRTLFDLTIPAGSIQGSVSAENAEVVTDPVSSDGSANQSFELGEVPYVDGSSSVLFGLDSYTEVDNFLESGGSDLHFVVAVDEDDQATIEFGDGINGAIPVGAGEVSYKIGGGSSGNVDANSLTVFQNGAEFSTNTGEGVRLTVRNPSAAAGGVDRMSVEEARVAIPASIRTAGNRSVTQSDFEDNAKRVRGVARSMMLTSDDDISIPENTGKLYIVPVGGGLPSTALKNEVADLINNDYPPTLSFSFTVEDPGLRIINVSAEVFLARNVTEAAARSAIESALDDFFALRDADGIENPQIDFGYKIRTFTMPDGSQQGEIPFSDIFNAIRDAADSSGNLVLRKVEEDSVVPADDVILLDSQFPVLGSVTLFNGDTGGSF